MGDPCSTGRDHQLSGSEIEMCALSIGFRAAVRTGVPPMEQLLLLQVRERELHRPQFSSIEILYISDQLSDSSSLSD